VAFSKSFNKELYENKIDKNIKEWGMIHFLNYSIFEAKDSGEWYKVEGFMEGNFEKLSNNYDKLNDQLETRHLTAFSHYTYEKSDFCYMVTDF
jgi:hypothetical protein